MNFVKLFLLERKDILKSLDISKRKYNFLLYTLFIYALYHIYWHYTLFIEKLDF